MFITFKNEDFNGIALTEHYF